MCRNIVSPSPTESVFLDDPFVKKGAGFRRVLEGPEVHCHETETADEGGPLVIVHGQPVEVSAHIYPSPRDTSHPDRTASGPSSVPCGGAVEEEAGRLFRSDFVPAKGTPDQHPTASTHASTVKITRSVTIKNQGFSQ